MLAEEVRANFDASVTRLVTRGNEVVDQITFKSSYRPTNRMYLIGIGGR